MADHYAVIGHPVEHSKSPAIHATFAAQTGEDIAYGLLPSARNAFVETAARFFAEGGMGLNITLPFKEEAARFADFLTDRADAAGAVNTLKQLEDGRREGDNTDGAGLVRDITVNLGFAPGGRRLLLLGAGGAARGVLAPLLATRPECVVIANRTAERAVELARRFAARGTVTGVGLDTLAGQAPFDLVINATSAGLSDTVPELPDGLFAANALAYDMIYGDAATAFERWARENGAQRTSDGLGMLIEQAAESFLLWRGIRPDTAPVLSQFRDRRNSGD